MSVGALVVEFRPSARLLSVPFTSVSLSYVVRIVLSLYRFLYSFCRFTHTLILCI